MENFFGFVVVFFLGYIVGMFGSDIYDFLTSLVLNGKEQDPEDLKDGPTATIWESNQYCPICAKEPTHKEQMSNICLGCGSQTNLLNASFRSYRKIFNGKKWIYQIRYGSKTVFSDKLFGKQSLPNDEIEIPPHMSGRKERHYF